MNEVQKWIGIATVVIDVLMGLFPPWHINWQRSEGGVMQINKGYQFILCPLPAGTITISTLFVQIAVVTLSGSVLYMLMRSKN